MDDKFIVGLMLGMVGGALIVANSAKARGLVKKGQTEVTEKVKDMKNKATKKHEKGEKATNAENTEANE